jgi:hypothetical protein
MELSHKVMFLLIMVTVLATFVVLTKIRRWTVPLLQAARATQDILFQVTHLLHADNWYRVIQDIAQKLPQTARVPIAIIVQWASTKEEDIIISRVMKVAYHALQVWQHHMQGQLREMVPMVVNARKDTSNLRGGKLLVALLAQWANITGLTGTHLGTNPNVRIVRLVQRLCLWDLSIMMDLIQFRTMFVCVAQDW